MKSSKSASNVNKRPSSANQIQTKKVKTLISPFLEEEKFIQSNYPCKHRAKPVDNLIIPVNNDEKRYRIGINGPLIVTHKDLPEKIQLKQHPKPSKGLFNQRTPKYTFFQDHKDCWETQFYWVDLKHPKILRHYSPERKCFIKHNVINHYIHKHNTHNKQL